MSESFVDVPAPSEKGPNMRTTWLGFLVMLGLISPTAQAQRISAGSTPQGDYLRGIGIEAWGMGQYNLNTARGYAITVDADIKLDTYMNEVFRAARDNWNKLDRLREEKWKAGYQANKERISEHPERLDVFTGNALNATLEKLNDPSIQEASLRSAPVTLPREMVRRIPFKLDEKGLIFSLQRLTLRGKGKLPVAFQDVKFAPYLKDCDKAIDKALDQMIDGKVEPETITQYIHAVERLSNKLEEEYGHNPDRVYTEAKSRVREMQAAINLIKTLKMQPVMAGLDHYTGKTVNDLRQFMLEHNLKFAAVDSSDERALYIELYAALDQVREIVVGRAKGDDR